MHLNDKRVRRERYEVRHKGYDNYVHLLLGALTETELSKQINKMKQQYQCLPSQEDLQ
jgi:hypothetical protein